MFHWFKKHSESGLEMPDPTPIEVPLRTKPLTLAEQMQRFVTDDEHKARLRANGIDTFDEADDFDTGDLEPDDFKSQFEDDFEGEAMMPLNRVRTRLDEQKAGLVADMPPDRQFEAQQRLRSKPKAQPAAVADSEIKAKINS